MALDWNRIPIFIRLRLRRHIHLPAHFCEGSYKIIPTNKQVTAANGTSIELIGEALG